MKRTLHSFVAQFVGVVSATLFCVAGVAFLSTPLYLGKHPGEISQPR
ncbi:hypothetical protein [Massilia sp. TS11]|nr:hypothetical protein [Massilia sp. TS11]MCG2584331.1 hypothetical protein [Massilia sp. TS11]